MTYGTPTWIWSVAVDGALYVRGYYGRNTRWYQVALRQKAGRIIAADMTKEVTFEPVDGPINDLIDDACRAKYRDSPYLSPPAPAPPRSRSCRTTAMPDRLVTEPDTAERISKFYAEIAVPADSFARAVAFALTEPEVDVSGILFRPTRQEL